MITRRTFLRGSAAGVLCAAPAFAETLRATAEEFKGRKVFDELMKKAQADGWSKLPIGECMKRVAMELEGTPYVGFTLELGADREVCAVNLEGLDCVTFFENTLGFARMLKKGGSTRQAMVDEITYTRYRGGKLTDFTSRLHYTNDWMHDNE